MEEFVMPRWEVVLWGTLFSGMAIMATVGNLIVIWVVVTTKSMHTVTNYFIVNLSIADIFISGINVTVNNITFIHRKWLSDHLCKISQFLAIFSISAEAFTLVAIAIDRYVAIMKPLRARMSKRCTLAIITIIWMVSAVIATPWFLYFTTKEVTTTKGMRLVCVSDWPDEVSENVYFIVRLLLTHFLPITLMIVTYSRVGFELWSSKAIGEFTPNQLQNLRSKRKIVKMMIIVVLIFGICWLPVYISFIMRSFFKEFHKQYFNFEIFLFMYWLGLSHSMYNPIIYCWMNSRFRNGFKRFFRWITFMRVGAESSNSRDGI